MDDDNEDRETEIDTRPRQGQTWNQTPWREWNCGGRGKGPGSTKVIESRGIGFRRQVRRKQ